MSSYYSANNSLPPCNYSNPCNTMLSYPGGNGGWSNNNTSNCAPSSCFRPLQQLYKTVYAPPNGNHSSNLNFECICRPAERYKSTNMTYGSFLYDNQLSGQKDQVLNYDRAIFARCYDNNKRAAHQSNGGDRARDSFNMNNPNDVQESQLWTATTSDACCPVNCCTNTTYNNNNKCPSYQNNASCYSPCSSNTMPRCSTPNNASNVPCL